MRTIRKIEQKISGLKQRKKVAAYARVSMESERMHHSLSAQVSYYSSLIQKNPDWEYAGVYADYGISGTGMKKRQEFQRMLEDTEAGTIDIILTKSIQRFARNTVDLLRTVRHLKELGIEVWFEKENIHTMSGDGELMMTILASFAQEESRSISENVRWRIKKQFEQGNPNGRFRVYGYRWEGDNLVVVPEEAAVVRRIFQNFLDGKSRLETEREFAAEGITTRNGYRWMDSNIKVVLTNVTYTGNMLFQKEYVTDPILKKRKKNRGELPKYYVENTHEPIIDKETFDYVQQEMARRKELGALANKSLNTTCFTGKIKCGICGRSYMHNLHTDRGFEEFWDCGSHKLKGRNCGAKGSIPQAVLVKECAEVLGLDDFDEQAFLDQVEKIVVPEYHVMVFCMKNGQKLIRHWVSTAKKDCWTEEYKNRQRAWMKNYMANGKGTRFSAFTTRVRCAVCGHAFRRCKQRKKQGISVHWRCGQGGKCSSLSVREEDLMKIAADAMGLEAFDGDRFREEIDFMEAGAEDRIIIHFKDGRIQTVPWTKPKKQGTRHTETYKEYMSQLGKKGWTPERKQRMSEQMKALRKERGENWQRQ
jgi:DNA invertase Pin-like site-specific DNA recombinase